MLVTRVKRTFGGAHDGVGQQPRQQALPAPAQETGQCNARTLDRHSVGLIASIVLFAAVVSVDQAAVVGLTGQPLQLAAQGAAMHQTGLVYMPPNQVLPQGAGHTPGYPVSMGFVFWVVLSRPGMYV